MLNALCLSADGLNRPHPRHILEIAMPLPIFTAFLMALFVLLFVPHAEDVFSVGLAVGCALLLMAVLFVIAGILLGLAEKKPDEK